MQVLVNYSTNQENISSFDHYRKNKTRNNHHTPQLKKKIMLRKNLQVLAYVLCIGGAQIVAAPPSKADEPPKNETPIRSRLTGDDVDIDLSYRRMGESYEQQTKWLTDVVESTADDSLSDKVRKFGAVNLLGQMRATCAVDVLIKNLMFCPGVWYDSPMHPPQAYYPSALALKHIGDTAIPALIRHINDSLSEDERHLACWVLAQIDGGEQHDERNKQFSIMRLQMFKGIGSKGRENISEAIVYIQSDFKAPFLTKAPETKK